MKVAAEQFEKIKRWMYRNARPLDIARWKYNFENGSREEVLIALSCYQNLDGGFGYALEADNWNTNSSPIQTWCATEILYELNITEKDNEIVKGILNYLSSGKDFDDGYWYAEVPSNDEFPHAPWWSYGEKVIEEWGYNPTVCLAGFVLYFSEKDTELYKLSLELVKNAFNDFINNKYSEGMHEIACFKRCYEYCINGGIDGVFDTKKALACLKRKIKIAISEDREKWKTEYVCKPSQFMITPDSNFYDENQELSDYEVEFIISTMEQDGSWNIPWNWGAYPEEWAISKNWWKADVAIKNLKYLKGHGEL